MGSPDQITFSWLIVFVVGSMIALIVIAESFQESDEELAVHASTFRHTVEVVHLASLKILLWIVWQILHEPT